jgi:membrane-anchored protein YejM (alkaline phosphatase superfamily)
MKLFENKKQLIRWCGWFSLGNAILLWVFCFKYLLTAFWLYVGYPLALSAKIFSITFLVLSYLAQIALLAFLPLCLFIPVIMIFPQRFLISIGLISVAFTLATYLMMDSVIYSIFHFHLTGDLLKIIMSAWDKQFFPMSYLEYILSLVISFSLLFVECAYGLFIWKVISKNQQLQGVAKGLVIFIVATIITAYSAMMFMPRNVKAEHMLATVMRTLPFYEDMDHLISREPAGRLKLELLGARDLFKSDHDRTALNYPLTKMNCAVNNKPMNLVIIVIDTWRFDMLNAEITPGIAHFSKQAWEFKEHMSGGNCTGPGVFSLFYSLPAYYWNSMTSQHRSPVLIDELLRHHYQMGIFASATLTYPAFDQNIFSAVKNLQLLTPGDSAAERDHMITQEFQQFIPKAVAANQPFFSFLFYDSAHSYCNVNNASKPFQPAIEQCDHLSLTSQTDPRPYINRYKNALHNVDAEVQQVLQTLKERALLDNTVVVITGDHGEEFNDDHMGYWGHGSNFTHYQVQTPLVVYWPGENPAVFDHATSHYDIAPTLMNKLLGCSTPSVDYSLGTDLLDKSAKSYLIANSYLNLGVMEGDQITTITSSGGLQIDQENGGNLHSTNLNSVIIKKVIADLGRFYKS